MRQAPFLELISNRNPCHTSTNGVELNVKSTLTVILHMVTFEFPCEVIGYHMAAEWNEDFGNVLPDEEIKARFWIQGANTDTYFPARVLPNSDTINNDGTSTYEVELGLFSESWDTTYYEFKDYTFDFYLRNRVRIDYPGVYWVGMAYTSYGTGLLRASRTDGAQRGLSDLLFKGTTPSNLAGVTALTIPENLTDSNTELSEVIDYRNINIWPIAQRINPAVPYGG